MLKAEWQSIWQDKKFTLSIAVMFIMPILYAGMLLWAFWDPYSQIDQLPVAIVNEDTGAEFEGQQLAIGDELIDKLLESETFDFIEVDDQDIEQGLLDQQYYLSIRIPENFSQHATTLLDENPQQLEIEYKANEGYNFLSSKIGDSAINQIQEEVNENVAKAYAEQLFTAISTLGDGYIEAADGASKINDGAAQLAGGADDLKGYLAQLASSTVTLSDGTQKLYNGVISASNGTEQLVSGSTSLVNGTAQLADGTGSLATGANNLQSGINRYVAGVADVQNGQSQIVEQQQQITNGAASLATGAQNLQGSMQQVEAGAASIAAQVAQLQSALAQLPAEQQQSLQATIASLQQSSQQLVAGADQAAGGFAQLAASASKLAEGSTAIANGQQKMLAGIEQLTGSSAALTNGAASVVQGSATINEKINELLTGANSLAAGTKELKSGLSEVVAGTASLNEGTSALSTKSADLAAGSVTLANGTHDLVDGTTELSTSLEEAGEEAKISVSDSNYEMLASPVTVDKEIKFENENYGTGLAPYFISLGLFVGALLLTNVYPFVQPAKQPTGVVSWFISKSAVPFVVWIFQVAITIVVLMFGLGLQPESMWLFVLTVAVTSMCFLAIVQMLTVLLGDVGRFLSLIFLIMQLTASAGTFPVELLPGKLQILHDWMPMTYSVRAFRAVIASGDIAIITNCLTILSVIGVVCVIISFAFFALLYKRRYSKMTEAVEI